MNGRRGGANIDSIWARWPSEVPRDPLFGQLLDAITPIALSGRLLELRWTNPGTLVQLSRDKKALLLPFLSFRDGDAMALWFSDTGEGAIPVVILSSEGEHRVFAPTVAACCNLVNRRKTGFNELDTSNISTIPASTTRSLQNAALERRFREWVQTAPPSVPDDKTAQALRRTLVTATRMLRREMVGSRARSYWQEDLRAERVANGFRWRHLTNGAWRLVKPGVFDSVNALLLKILSKHRRKSFDIIVTQEGLVSIDNDRVLLASPPERKRTT